MTSRSKKQSALEASIDQARISKDWNTAVSSVKRLAKQLNVTKLSLEDVVTAESLLEKDAKQAADVLTAVLQKEADNEVRYMIRNL